MSYILVSAISVILTAGIVKVIENIKFSALLYYIVEKGYTEPTKEEMERCIDIVSNKTVNEWFMK